MAEKLDSFAFDGRGGPSKYKPYLDGAIYRLKVGEDIHSTKCHSSIRVLAHRHGLKVHIKIEPDALVVQAYKSDKPLRRIA